MQILIRFLILTLLIAMTGELFAPPLEPAHSHSAPAAAAQQKTVANALQAEISAHAPTSPCSHHCGACEEASHCHLAHCAVQQNDRTQTCNETVEPRLFAVDDSAPASPSLDSIKRPPRRA